MSDFQPIKVHVRWLIRRDMPEVMAIEDECFEFPWSEDDFIRCLRQRNCIGIVAVETCDGKEVAVRGFMIYELHKNRLHVLNFAVARGFQRRGIGTQMIDKLVKKLSNQHRNRIMLEVRESNLPAQLFFRANGFRAVSLLREHYDDTGEDGYLMQFTCDAPAFADQE